MKHFRFSYFLIGCAAIAQGVMWVNVFALLHFGAMAYVAGFPAGIAIVGIVTRGANLLPRTQSKRARQAGAGVLFAIVVTETAVLGTANYVMFPNVVIAYGVSFVITSALIFGALVERSLVPTKKKVAETIPKAERKKKKIARKQVKDAQLIAYFREHDGASDTQAAEHFGVSRQAIGQRRKKLFAVRQEASK